MVLPFCLYVSCDDPYEISASLDKNCLFGGQDKQCNFFVIFHNASDEEALQQTIFKEGEEGKHWAQESQIDGFHQEAVVDARVNPATKSPGSVGNKC